MKVPPHVFTLTGNLLAERTQEFSRWEAGRTQRATAESFQVGGKGINVSKMLNRLRVPNTALCFTGGAPGTESEEWLQEHGFAYRAFETDRPTRVGLVVRTPDAPETTFLGPDAAPSADAIAACAAFLDAQPDGQILAVCGSLPGWPLPEFDPLRAALERWTKRGVLAADTYRAPLLWFATQPIALVKINASELRTIADHGRDIPTALAGLSGRGRPARWVVTDGPHHVWFAERATAPKCLLPPSVREVSPTGSGDVMFASLLVSLFHEGRPLRPAVETALPLAAANAAHPGIAEFP